jgi:hypothetical protein
MSPVVIVSWLLHQKEKMYVIDVCVCVCCVCAVCVFVVVGV